SATVNRFAGIHWTADGQALTYVDSLNGYSNIWSQPLDGSPPKRLTDFKGDQTLSFDWSPDGKRLALLRGVVVSHIVSISDFKCAVWLVLVRRSVIVDDLPPLPESVEDERIKPAKFLAVGHRQFPTPAHDCPVRP